MVGRTVCWNKNRQVISRLEQFQEKKFQGNPNPAYRQQTRCFGTIVLDNEARGFLPGDHYEISTH
jgi:hypothetical protein